MAELKQIREYIREMAHRTKGVRLSEIEWVVRNLALNGYGTRSKSNGHQTIFTVDRLKFGVCSHHSGSSQVKSEYVKQFLNVMMELGLYDE
jgi:hypothetical protein